VLSDFADDERGWLESLLDTIAEAAPLLVSADEHAFANKVARLLAPAPTTPAASGEPPPERDPPEHA